MAGWPSGGIFNEAPEDQDNIFDADGADATDGPLTREQDQEAEYAHPAQPPRAAQAQARPPQAGPAQAQARPPQAGPAQAQARPPQAGPAPARAAQQPRPQQAPPRPAYRHPPRVRPAEILPPGDPAGDDARAIYDDRPTLRQEGLTMRVERAADGSAVFYVARAVNGRPVENWRLPTPQEMDFVRANGKITRLGEVPPANAAPAVVQGGQGGTSLITVALIAAATAGGIWWWKSRGKPAPGEDAAEDLGAGDE